MEITEKLSKYKKGDRVIEREKKFTGYGRKLKAVKAEEKASLRRTGVVESAQFIRTANQRNLIEYVHVYWGKSSRTSRHLASRIEKIDNF